ncbi:hypothetical protein EN35_27850 [Rhodococcus qingshengii]|nr:hypothetical protein EN35_27850 [Rhodococcus qingshengii]
MSEEPLVSGVSGNEEDSRNRTADEEPKLVDVDSRDVDNSTVGFFDLGEIGEKLGAMGAQLEMFHARSEQYESIIRRMQSKIEDLQSDQVRTLLKPVINRLAVLYTEAVSAAQRAADRGDLKSQKDFGYFADEVEEGLGMLDIESLDTQVDDEFDAARHAARGTAVTGDQSLDRKVASVVRQGFTYVGAERVFLPALVKVYRFDPNSAVPQDMQPPNNEPFAESEGVN